MENQFKKIETPLAGVFLVERVTHRDLRGDFTKTYNQQMIRDLDIGFDTPIKESLCSVSKRNVIRGMHFQNPPFSCSKFVSVVEGEIIDVIVCLGTDSKKNDFGKVFSVNLSSANSVSLFVPEGFAHGFLVLSDYAVVVYHQSNVFNSEADSGVRFDSLNFDWPVNSPIVSQKDLLLPALKDSSIG